MCYGYYRDLTNEEKQELLKREKEWLEKRLEEIKKTREQLEKMEKEEPVSVGS